MLNSTLQLETVNMGQVLSGIWDPIILKCSLVPNDGYYLRTAKAMRKPQRFAQSYHKDRA